MTPMAQQGPGGGGHPFTQFFQQQSGGSSISIPAWALVVVGVC
jgi:hypothetical protein